MERERVCVCMCMCVYRKRISKYDLINDVLCDGKRCRCRRRRGIAHVQRMSMSLNEKVVDKRAVIRQCLRTHAAPNLMTKTNSNRNFKTTTNNKQDNPHTKSYSASVNEGM